jgi:hypothetical protein
VRREAAGVWGLRPPIQRKNSLLVKIQFSKSEEYMGSFFLKNLKKIHLLDEYQFTDAIISIYSELWGDSKEGECYNVAANNFSGG